MSTDRRNSDQRASGAARTPPSEAPGVSIGIVPQHRRKPMLPKSAWAACKSIVEKSDSALTNPTDAAALAQVLREVKAHAASCLSTFDMEQ